MSRNANEVNKELLDVMKEIIKNDPELLKKLNEEAQKEVNTKNASDILKEEAEKLDKVQEFDANKYTFTDNGAMVLKTTGKPFVDMNFALSSFRGARGEELQGLIDKFDACFKADHMLAWKYMFYVGDIREGAGERRAFLEMYKYMLTHEYPETYKHMLVLVAEYNRFDMLFKIWEVAKNLSVNEEYYELRYLFRPIADIIFKQMESDIKNAQEGKPISLLAKWMPSINTSSKRTKELGFDAMKMLSLNPTDPHHQKVYRKSIAGLRKYLNVVEVSMSDNSWNEINYEGVPSKAALKYKNAFCKHDGSRYSEYLSKAVKGEAKFNASVTQPHEIMSKVRQTRYFDHDPALIAAWNNLKDLVVEDTIVVCDTSGSMSSTVGGANNIHAIDVSTALAIYCAERLHGSMHNKFITFSKKPQFVELPEGDIYDKMNSLNCINDNTDIEKVFALLASSYANGGIKDIDMPSKVLIISDMQFDAARIKIVNDKYYNESQEDLFSSIKRQWKAMTDDKVKMPKLIFWNVCACDKDTIPMEENENGLILLSGFSTNLLKMAMSGEYDPFKALLEVLSSERYDQVQYEYNYASCL